MQNNSFFQLLSDLNIKEVALFVHFFTNTNQSTDAIKLLKFLIANKDKKNIADKKWIFRKLFNNENYNDQKLRHLLFILNESLEKHIYLQQKETDDFEKHYYLLEYYRQRKLYKLYEKTYKQINSINEKNTQSSNQYLRKYLLAQSYNKYLKAKQIRTIEPKLQEVSDSLDMFYISQKLFIQLEAANYKSMIKIDYQIDYIDELLPLIATNKKQQHPLINTIIYAINTIKNNQDENNFNAFIEHFNTYKTLFDTELIDDLLVVAKNYCIKKINTGASRFTTILFDLYKEELLQDEKKHKYQIAPATYKNIVSTAFSLNDYEWANNFINKYTTYLPIELQHSYMSYNKARYHFHFKDYDLVSKLLLDVEYSDFFIMFNAKALEIKTYFEQKEWNILDSLLKSFNMLLRNKKSVSYHKEYYDNFIISTNKLKNCYLEINKKKRKATIAKFVVAEKTIDKAWILEKIEELQQLNK